MGTKKRTLVSDSVAYDYLMQYDGVFKDALIKEIKALDKNDLLPNLPDISEPSAILAKHTADSKEQQ